MIIWYIFSVLVCFTNKNLAALLHWRRVKPFTPFVVDMCRGPDWANFRPLGDCLLFNSFTLKKYGSSPYFWATTFHNYIIELNFAKMGWAIPLTIFYKLIWSPWSYITLFIETTYYYVQPVF
jgi:hypothetical protein